MSVTITFGKHLLFSVQSVWFLIIITFGKYLLFSVKSVWFLIIITFGKHLLFSVQSVWFLIINHHHALIKISKIHLTLTLNLNCY
jgi:hypothetical protein